MALVGGFSFIGGMFFFLLGAWPVVGFLGLDVLLVYWAFRANYRAAAAFEEVTVTPSELRVRRVSHRGEVAEWTLNPLWTQLDRETHEEFGVLKLFLVSRGRKLPVAGFLSPAGKGKLRRGAVGGAGRGQARADAGCRFRSEIGWDGRTVSGLDGEQHDGGTPCSRPTAFPTSRRCRRAAADYDIVRRAIAHIRGNWRAQPEIEEIAEAAGVTPTELHHLFRRWAGLTPKAFLQALTLDSARKLLRDSASVLDASYEVGLVRPRPAARPVRHPRGDVARRMEVRRRRADHLLRLPSLRRSAPRW